MVSTPIPSICLRHKDLRRVSPKLRGITLFLKIRNSLFNKYKLIFIITNHKENLNSKLKIFLTDTYNVIERNDHTIKKLYNLPVLYKLQ